MQQEFERLCMGATIRTIGMPDVNMFAVPVPPRTEQLAVVQHVAAGTGQIDRLISRVRTHVERLREYRIALISAAVTGKIDVRAQVTP